MVFSPGGGWSVWGVHEQYSDCNRACGGGNMTTIRRRKCENPGEDGTECPGLPTNYSIDICNVDPCFCKLYKYAL